MKIAIIVAGGTSTRYGKDKLGEQLLGKSVLQHSVDVFKSVSDQVIVVGQHVDGVLYAKGGSTRFQSVLNGISAIANDAHGVVAIHDGARPFITRRFVEYLIYLQFIGQIANGLQNLINGRCFIFGTHGIGRRRNRAISLAHGNAIVGYGL